jgi:hypothetical protein
VDALLENHPNQPVAYYYFDYQRQKGHINMLSGILQQLVLSSDEIHEDLKKAYEACESTGRSLTLRDRERLILAIAGKLSAFIVIDALDECDGQNRQSVLNLLRSFRSINSLRVFVTGRPHIKEFTTAFQQDLQVEITAHDDDLKLCLQHEIQIRNVYGIVSDDFAERIVNTIVAGAHGMRVVPVARVSVSPG